MSADPTDRPSGSEVEETYLPYVAKDGVPKALEPVSVYCIVLN
jgi:hypothetical protein